MSRTETAGAQGVRQAAKKQVEAVKAAAKGRPSAKPEGGHARAPARADHASRAQESAAVREALGPMNGISPEQWRVMVAEAAYYRAQRRGFDGGSPEQDWYEAEDEIRRSLEER
jgi:hypothetical protein